MLDRFEKFSFLIADISRCWHKLAGEVMEKEGLKGPYAVYFTTMYRFPEGITAARLSELCSKDKADVSRAINLLEQRGHVEKVAPENGAYRAPLRLTESGKELYLHIAKKAAQAVDNGGKGLSGKEREIFYKSLELISQNLQKLAEEGL